MFYRSSLKELLMDRKMLFASLLTLSLFGCAPSNSSGVSTGTILGSLGDLSAATSVDYMGLEDRIVLVMWSDVVGSSSSKSASSENGVTLHGESNSKDGRKLAWKCDAFAGGDGTLTLGDEKYDLVDGCIFLVSTRAGSLNVLQLSREAIATSDVTRSIRELAKENEITAFFSRQSPEDGT
jgi:hypothetical protein